MQGVVSVHKHAYSFFRHLVFFFLTPGDLHPCGKSKNLQTCKYIWYLGSGSLQVYKCSSIVKKLKKNKF